MEKNTDFFFRIICFLSMEHCDGLNKFYFLKILGSFIKNPAYFNFVNSSFFPHQ